MGASRQTQRASILVVDDEPTIAEIVARYLDRAGFATRTAGDGLEALALVAAQRPDLVVLDLMLPGIDGLEVLRRLHDAEGPPLPVLMLTARGEESDRITGLRSGADDYVVKPFSPAELVARVEAILRRSEPAPDEGPVLSFEGLVIDPPARRVHVHREEVTLTAREFDLLLFLARHPARVFTRDQLMDAVWQYPFWTDATTVTVHVRRLRTKIEADPAQPRWVQTVWGVGYRFQP